MLPVKIGPKYIFRPLILGYPETCLTLGEGVTQTSVVAVLAYQSTHTIYHIKQSVLVISTHTFKLFVFITNNRQQNKLVNMVDGSDLIKHSYWLYKYLTYVF